MTRNSRIFGLVTLIALIVLHASGLISLRLFVVLAGIAGVTAFTNFGRSCPLVMSIRWWLQNRSARTPSTTDQLRAPESSTMNERNR